MTLPVFGNTNKLLRIVLRGHRQATGSGYMDVGYIEEYTLGALTSVLNARKYGNVRIEVEASPVKDVQHPYGDWDVVYVGGTLERHAVFYDYIEYTPKGIVVKPYGHIHRLFDCSAAEEFVVSKRVVHGTYKDCVTKLKQPCTCTCLYGISPWGTEAAAMWALQNRKMLGSKSQLTVVGYGDYSTRSIATWTELVMEGV
jgi:hypothetical protein